MDGWKFFFTPFCKYLVNLLVLLNTSSRALAKQSSTIFSQSADLDCFANSRKDGYFLLT